MTRFAKILIILAFFLASEAKGQEIDFGNYYDYTVTLSELNPLSDLEFGTLFQNQGTVNIDITEAKVLTLEGVRYLDVLVTITADNNMVNTDMGCSGNCTIPFTLEAAYANLGADNTGQSTLMPVISNVANAQFPILKRTSGAPGPPPTPVYEGYDPSLFNETAYLYIYGSITVGLVSAGTYSSTITVSVSYD